MTATPSSLPHRTANAAAQGKSRRISRFPPFPCLPGDPVSGGTSQAGICSRGLLAGACLLGLTAIADTESASAALTYSGLLQDRWVIHYQRDPDSAPEPLVSQGSADGNAPALAPDGRHIAFDAHGREIHVCPRQGKTTCRIIDVPGRAVVHPAWHPLTGELVMTGFATGAGGEDAELFSTAGGLDTVEALIEQTGILDYATLSPDGRRIAYSAGQSISLLRGGTQVVNNLWTMDLVTGHARPLLAGSARDIHPKWSPTGNTLAFASNRSGRFEVWVVGRDGAGLRQVTSGTGSKTWPAWSPDGRSLLFTRYEGGRYSLWLIEVDGSGLRPFQPYGAGSDMQLRDADWK